MANSIALVFSKIIDPANPLHLEDECKEDPTDWEFGMTMLRTQPRTPQIDKPEELSSMSEKNPELSKNSRNDGGKQKADKESFVIRLVDPDEVVDPAILDNQSLTEDEDDYESKSEASSDSSLVPYDLSDDGADLKKRFSQLTDIILALRKSDDPDGVCDSISKMNILKIQIFQKECQLYQMLGVNLYPLVCIGRHNIYALFFYNIYLVN